MYNLTKLTCLLFLLLSALACSKETRRETPGAGEPIYIYPVKTLEDYLYNVDQLGQRRNADGFEPIQMPNLAPIPKLDSLIFEALVADTTSFESIRPPYYLQAITSTNAKVVGATCYLEVGIVADTSRKFPNGALVKLKNAPVNAISFNEDTLPNTSGAYKFYLQEKWDYEQRSFGDNVVVFGHVRNNVVTCYAMVYTDYFF